MNMFKELFVRILNTLARHLLPNRIRVTIHRMRGIKIGKNTFIGKYCYLDDKAPSLIQIGNNVGISINVVMLVHRRDISNYSKGKGYNDYPFKFGKITIMDNVQIGCNSVIMPGVTVGKGAIIGAGSIVTKNIPQYSIAVGVPAKVIKRF